MRDSTTPATLGELLGEGFEGRTQLALNDLPKLLGEKMPEIKFDRVGRLRLLNSLRMRFGDGYRNVPGIKDLLGEFDKEIKVNSIVKLNRRR